MNVYLKGGQTVTVDLKVEKPDELNTQIDDFFKVLGDKSKQEGNYLFQGVRIIMIRLADVSAADASVFVSSAPSAHGSCN